MSVITLNKNGAKASAPAKLDKTIFELDVTNHELIRLAYENFSAEQRVVSATTKTRGLVRGGGRKPWRQKGTGRARFGSTRNPIWTGGGVVFGPSGNENYTTKLNKKAKLQAMRQALSLKVASNDLIVIESLPASGKTTDLSKLVSKFSAQGAVVLVDDVLSVELKRAVRNLPNLSLYSASYLNVKRVIDADKLVLTSKAVEALVARLGGQK